MCSLPPSCNQYSLDIDLFKHINTHPFIRRAIETSDFRIIGISKDNSIRRQAGLTSHLNILHLYL